MLKNCRSIMRQTLSLPAPGSGVLWLHGFNLRENPALLLPWVDEYQNHTKTGLSFLEFQTIKRGDFSPPTAPTIEPRFTDPLKQKAYEVWCQNRHPSFISYQKSYNEYQRKKSLQAMLQQFSLSPEGYIAYAQTHILPTTPEAFFLKRRALPISQTDIARHVYVNGGSGSGKTETLKQLIFQQLHSHIPEAIVLIDPHGELAYEIAHFPEIAKSGKLVYIDPTLDPHLIPGLNPFDIKETDPHKIDAIAAQIVEAFEQIIQMPITPQMNMVLKICILTLLVRPNSDIHDLIRFMDNARNEDLIAYGIQHLYNHANRMFLETAFAAKQYDQTKSGIASRLQSLVSNIYLERILSGRATVDLEHLIQKRSIVIFRLLIGPLSAEITELLGRLITARIASFAFSQSEIPKEKRAHIHLVIDECQLFISKSMEDIFAQARKFGLHITMAQQVFGQGMSSEMQRIAIGNSWIKICGNNSEENLSKMAKEIGVKTDELQTLKTGEFYIASRGKLAVRVKMPANLIGVRHSVSSSQWEKSLGEQKALYYREKGEKVFVGSQAPNQKRPVTTAGLKSNKPIV